MHLKARWNTNCTKPGPATVTRTIDFCRVLPQIQKVKILLFPFIPARCTQPENPLGKQCTCLPFVFLKFQNKYFITNESDNAEILDKIP